MTKFFFIALLSALRGAVVALVILVLCSLGVVLAFARGAVVRFLLSVGVILAVGSGGGFWPVVVIARLCLVFAMPKAFSGGFLGFGGLFELGRA
ncbi:hypothetical protein [Ahrensia kielensis]|uniref:hypothetical protein n=1 Tax=Ahrensia kielensis TaxID=76980 RepID=UPI0003762F34|nr:hypothetical protein [Ahrensia kielensis]